MKRALYLSLLLLTSCGAVSGWLAEPVSPDSAVTQGDVVTEVVGAAANAWIPGLGVALTAVLGLVTARFVKGKPKA